MLMSEPNTWKKGVVLPAVPLAVSLSLKMIRMTRPSISMLRSTGDRVELIRSPRLPPALNAPPPAAISTSPDIIPAIPADVTIKAPSAFFTPLPSKVNDPLVTARLVTVDVVPSGFSTVPCSNANVAVNDNPPDSPMVTVTSLPTTLI